MNLNFLNPLQPVLDIIKKAVPDKDLAVKVAGDIQKAAAAGDLNLLLAQIGVNKEQAKSRFWWVAGARPGFMWGCLAIIVFNYIAAPTYNSISSANPDTTA